MNKIAFILVLLTLTVCSCKTKYIETVHYEPVEVHDTVLNTIHVRDSITLLDSIFIHQKNDTVYSERWRTEHHWHTKHDTVYKSKEVPVALTDTIVSIREVPVEKVVYKQKWWQKSLSGVGIITLLSILIGLLLKRSRII
jgi:hypothetical protein